MNAVSEDRTPKLKSCDNAVSAELSIKVRAKTNERVRRHQSVESKVFAPSHGGDTFSVSKETSLQGNSVPASNVDQYSKQTNAHAEFEFNVKSSKTRLLHCLANYRLISKEPWPELGIYSYSSITDGKWGYLYQFESGDFVFDSTVRPSDHKIMARWSSYLK